jgi:hypothetical protein
MSVYEVTLERLEHVIAAHKTINKFRAFLHTINPTLRYHYFDICRAYLENEYKNNERLSSVEKDSLMNLLEIHWKWKAFESASENWWNILAMNYSDCAPFTKLLQLWVVQSE